MREGGSNGEPDYCEGEEDGDVGVIEVNRAGHFLKMEGLAGESSGSNK